MLKKLWQTVFLFFFSNMANSFSEKSDSSYADLFFIMLILENYKESLSAGKLILENQLP